MQNESPFPGREYYEWCNFWWENAPDTESPRVLLIGDSITNQYRARTQAILKERGRPWLLDCTIGSRSAADPAWFAELDYMMSAVNGYTYRLVHLNNGLHGAHLSLPAYEDGLRRYIEKVRSLLPEAAVALVTSTPYEKASSNERVLARNEVVRRLSAEYGFLLDDLYTVAAAQPDAWRDGVHFKPETAERLAVAAADFIERALG